MTKIHFLKKEYNKLIDPKYNLDMLRPSLSLPSELPTLNNDEIKRIVSVIDRDFKLRQKESKRIE